MVASKARHHPHVSRVPADLRQNGLMSVSVAAPSWPGFGRLWPGMKPHRRCRPNVARFRRSRAGLHRSSMRIRISGQAGGRIHTVLGTSVNRANPFALCARLVECISSTMRVRGMLSSGIGRRGGVQHVVLLRSSFAPGCPRLSRLYVDISRRRQKLARFRQRCQEFDPIWLDVGPNRPDVDQLMSEFDRRLPGVSQCWCVIEQRWSMEAESARLLTNAARCRQAQQSVQCSRPPGEAERLS